MWQVTGQARVVDLLRRSLEKGALAHAYLFSGPPHTGKMTLALELARAINCRSDEPPCGECEVCRKIAEGKHADVQIIALNGGVENGESGRRTEISIEQVRQMQHSASLPPFEGEYKLFIIDGAEILSLEAANCLLKTLEEPVERVVFVLLTTNASAIPETVISRCQKLGLHPMAAGDIEEALVEKYDIEPERARLLSRLCHGGIGWAIAAAENSELLERYNASRDEVLDIIKGGYGERFGYAATLAGQFSQNRQVVMQVLDLWLDVWRDIMLVKSGYAEAVNNIDITAKLAGLAEKFSLEVIRQYIGSVQAAEEQLRQNASPRLVLEVMMMDMPRERKEEARR